MREEEALDKRLLELNALFEVSRTLSSTLNLHTILENVLRIVMGHLLINRGMILLQEGTESAYLVEAVKGMPRNLIGSSLQITVAPTRTLLLAEAEPSEETAFFTKIGIALLCPLIASRGTIGIVAFGPKIDKHPYTEGEIEFLDSLANIAATAVSNGLMVREIQAINRRLDRKIQQLNTLFDVGGELASTLDPQKIASLLGFAVMGELLVNKCAVYLKGEKGLCRLIGKGVGLPDRLDESLCAFADPILLEDTDRFDALTSLGLAVLVPMRFQNQTKGILLVGSKITGHFDEADLEFLKALGHQAMTALENARLFHETLEKERMEEELHLARSIQEAMLPKTLPQPEGYRIAGINIPSREVGGDYFDIIPIGDHRFGLTIADVVGKGAGAALLMAHLQAALHALVGGDLPIEGLVSRLNNQIYRNTGPDRFITFFYGELDTRAHRLTYCNAGHNPPLLFRAKGGVDSLGEGGLILGMLPDQPYETRQVTLDPGDRLVLYTDGITEAHDTSGEEFGEERLIAYISDQAGDVVHVMEGLLEAVHAFSKSTVQADDMTLLLVGRKESAFP